MARAGRGKGASCARTGAAGAAVGISGAAVSAMAAQNIGAGRWDRVNAIAFKGTLIATGLTALATAAGLMAPTIEASSGLSSIDLVLVVIAIAGGATVLSHVNDSGFWLVGRFLGMDEKTTLRTWTVMETTLGLAAFGVALGLWWIGGVLA